MNLPLPNELVGNTQANRPHQAIYGEPHLPPYQSPILSTPMRALNSITGFGIEECLALGRRVSNLLRVLNVQHGFTAEQDSFSSRLGQLLPHGPGKGLGKVRTIEEINKNYYKDMGWCERKRLPLLRLS